jgi:hypothetical protein
LIIRLFLEDVCGSEYHPTAAATIWPAVSTARTSGMAAMLDSAETLRAV